MRPARYGLGFAKDFNKLSKAELLAKLRYPTSERQFIMYEALRKGASIDELYDLTKIKHWFLQQMKELVDEENALIEKKGAVPRRAGAPPGKARRIFRQIPQPDTRRFRGG